MKLNATLLVLTLTSSLVGCGSKDKSSPPTRDSSVRDNVLKPDGGMTSGGGGTLIQGAVGQEQASRTIQTAVKHLPLFFNYMTHVDQKDTAFKEFFTMFPNPAGIASELKSLKIKDATEGPCSFNGTATDGSYDPKEGLCISSHQLGQKLNANTIYSQTLALLVHELAHAYGASEDSAVYAQQLVITLLDNTSAQQAEDMVNDNKEALNNLTSILGFLPMDSKLYTQINLALVTQGQIRPLIPGLAYLSREQYLTFSGFQGQLFNFYFSAMANDDWNDFKVMKEEGEKKLELVFGKSMEAPCSLALDAASAETEDGKQTPSDMVPDCRVLRLVDKNGVNEKAFETAHNELKSRLAVVLTY